MLQRILLIIVLLPALSLSAVAGDSTTDLNDLLDALVAKQVFTQAEADAFRARWQARHSAEAATAITLPPAEASATLASPPAAQPTSSTRTSNFLGGIHFSGYGQARWTGSPGTTNTFEIRRARLIADGKLSDKITYQFQVDGVKPQLLDARVDFTVARQLRITVGQFKIPFSVESITSDDQLNLVERSTVVNSFAPGRDNGSVGRDLGLQFSGKALRLHHVDRVEYAIGVFNGAGLNTKDDNHYKDTAARLIFHPLAAVSVGGDYYRGATTAKEVIKERKDIEASYLRGPFHFTAEYIWGRDGLIHRRGWYAETGYQVSKHWLPLFRFDKYDPGQHTSTLTATDNYTFGTNYFLNDYVKIGANYGLQRDLVTDRVKSIFLAQTQFSFGGEKGDK